MLQYTLPLISKEAREEVALLIKSCPMFDGNRGWRREWGIGGSRAVRVFGFPGVPTTHDAAKGGGCLCNEPSLR